MNIFGKLATTFDPEYRHKTADADEIRTRTAAQGGIIKNQWYRLVTTQGKVVGFSFACKCGIEYKLLSAFEWLRDYKCPTCKEAFDILKSVGLRESSPISDLVPALAKLPSRPHVAGESVQQPRFMDTWNGADDGVGYEQHNPGASGVGFGVK